MLAHPAALPDWFQALRITSTSGAFECLVDDEYEDIDGTNPVAALQALILTILDDEDAKSDADWFERNSFSGVGDEARALLAGLSSFWRAYQAEVAEPTRSVDPHAWQLNSGQAHCLRHLNSLQARPFCCPGAISAWLNENQTGAHAFIPRYADARVVSVEERANQPTCRPHASYEMAAEHLRQRGYRTIPPELDRYGLIDGRVTYRASSQDQPGLCLLFSGEDRPRLEIVAT